MKKHILLTLICLVSLAGISFGATPLTRARLSSLVKDCRSYEGAEVVRLGSFTTGAVKGLVWIAGSGDPDTKELLKMCKGIKGISILEFEDCSAADRAAINDKIEHLLKNTDVLMDVKDEGERMLIYGVFDEKSGDVQDFILYSPDNCALICLFGRISMDAVSEMVK